MEAVAQQGGYTVDDLLRPCRTRPLVRWRQLAFYVARTHTRLSYTVLGRAFDRDHTSIVHGVGAMSNLVANNREWRERLERLNEILGPPLPDNWIEDVALQVSAALPVLAEMETAA